MSSLPPFGECVLAGHAHSGTDGICAHRAFPEDLGLSAVQGRIAYPDKGIPANGAILRQVPVLRIVVIDGYVRKPPVYRKAPDALAADTVIAAVFVDLLQHKLRHLCLGPYLLVPVHDDEYGLGQPFVAGYAVGHQR
ncbi:hypothetical protein SDC9_162549 [bioreactor metagenome]|uniref:Uncharacterized protein n=1 Tax=bioreactor metagenome TaxID=1076179 RepID=A0A645FMP8_9ZZZZ